MANLHIKKGDTVVVLSGDDKGVKGEVIATSPKEGKVLVKGVHIIHKHVKPRKQGETGGIVDAEGAIYACKVTLCCNNKNCDKYGKATRIGYKTEGDQKYRVCTKCGAKL